MALRSGSSSFTYDLFLSFRGSDTRQGFAANLYKALANRGIYTSIDDEELQSGEEITPTLLKAIEESRISMAVLSVNYASSSFCLDELATIFDCAERKALLVFYKVEPSHVRHRKVSYGEALAKKEERFKHNMDKLPKWKMPFYQAANLSGYHFKDGYAHEYEFIGRMVEQVCCKINPTCLHVADYLVGLESQVSKVMKLLDVGSDDGVHHMTGIHGMGGIGKTTLALSKKIKLASEQQGVSMIQHRLQRKKVLLILDDVDKLEQLLPLALEFIAKLFSQFHQSREPSSSFWFHNKFPDKVLSLVIAPVGDNGSRMFSPNPMVFINGKAHESVISWNEEMVRMEMDCIYLVDLQLIFGNLYEVPLENEWNHVEVTYVGVIKTSILKASRIYVIKQERSTEDI
ncbi:TMV resistance protein N [Glycine max]|nr:TMV resistance protein N [Glycine max]